MEFSRSSCHLNHSRMENDTDCYSGPEPQVLPFPPELVVRTLSYLDQACDKKNARLVCKGFAAAGLPSLTSTVYFSTSLINVAPNLEPPNIPHLSSSTREIAMHPVVSKYITRLVCDGTLLPEHYLVPENFENWWKSLGKTTLPAEPLRKTYTTRYLKEKWLIQGGEDRNFLRTALENFANLKHILFTDVAADEQSRDFPRAKWPSFPPGVNLWGPSSPYHTFAMCIRLLSEMAIKLDELSIEGRENAIPYTIFSTASPEDYNHMLNVFANLRKLSVRIDPQGHSYPLDFNGLGRLLAHPTMLQSLDLKCVSDGPSRTSLLMYKLHQGFHWPHLKHFGLYGFSMHTDTELIAFFQTHKASIESVTLHSMFLHEKDFLSTDRSPCQAWKHFFGELRKRSIKFQRLDLFEIYDCRGPKGRIPDLAARADGGRRVVKFLRDGGPNPLDRATKLIE